MENSFQIGDWLVDSIQNRLVRGDARVKLDPKVMQVLVCLAERPNEVVLKETILESVWEGTFVADEVLTNAIFELRKAFGDDAKEPRFIQTVPRKGYRLLAPVQSGNAPVGVAVFPPRGLLWVLFAAALVSVATWSVLRLGRTAPIVVSRFDLSVPAEEALTHLNDPVVAWSPDGKRIIYAGGQPTKLYVRAVDQVQSTAIPGTERASTAFFSPDGEWVGFYAGDDAVGGVLKKVRLATGSVVALCDVPNGWGASWGEDDTILFAPTITSGLFRVPASGGAPSAMTEPDTRRGETSHRFPEFLPGGKAALFTIWAGASETSSIAVLRLETGKHEVLVEGASFARYARTGHIVYARDGKLEGVPFDVGRLEVTGPAVPLYLEVRSHPDFGTAHFSLSRDGSLAYLEPPGPPQKTLLWVDRSGWTRPLTGIPRAYGFPRLSPDGKHLALTIEDEGSHIWVYDLDRETLTRVSGPGGRYPIWTPDGERVTFQTFEPPAIVWQEANGSGTAQRLVALTSPNSEPDSWSPDGKWLVYSDTRENTTTGADIRVFSLDGERSSRPFLQTEAAEGGGVFSPDGRWIAYDSNESGRMEVYVQPFPGPGGKWQVSTEGGRQPAWARKGREIFYRIDNKMMAVQVETEPALRLSKPQLLFEGDYDRGAGWYGYAHYDVTADGQHFLMVRAEEEPAPTRIHVVLDWAEELKAKVPPAR